MVMEVVVSGKLGTDCPNTRDLEALRDAMAQQIRDRLELNPDDVVTIIFTNHDVPSEISKVDALKALKTVDAYILQEDVRKRESTSAGVLGASFTLRRAIQAGSQ